MLSWLLSMQLECINLTAEFTKPMFRLDCRSSEQNSQPTNYYAHVEDFTRQVAYYVPYFGVKLDADS